VEEGGGIAVGLDWTVDSLAGGDCCCPSAFSDFLL
jgi:hypothetical protein